MDGNLLKSQLLTLKVIKVDPDFKFDKYLQLLIPEVVKSIYFYKFHKEQVVKFCSELLKYCYLSDLLHINPDNLGIRYNKYNKPFLTYKDKIHNIQFNISHAKEYVVIAVLDNFEYEIGIDIEYIDRNSIDFRDMATIVYSDFEQGQIKDADDFFNFWTLAGLGKIFKIGFLPRNTSLCLK